MALKISKIGRILKSRFPVLQTMSELNLRELLQPHYYFKRESTCTFLRRCEVVFSSSAGAAEMGQFSRYSALLTVSAFSRCNGLS